MVVTFTAVVAVVVVVDGEFDVAVFDDESDVAVVFCWGHSSSTTRQSGNVIHSLTHSLRIAVCVFVRN